MLALSRLGCVLQSLLPALLSPGAGTNPEISSRNLERPEPPALTGISELFATEEPLCYFPVVKQ